MTGNFVPLTDIIMQEFIVSNLEDENDGDFSEGDLSLREAIANAESGATITFDSNLSGGTISLIDDELTIDKSLTIQGLGAENIIIDGGGIENSLRVFKIDDNVDTESEVAINDLTIAGGSSQVSNPEAQNDTNPGQGGGVLNLENLTINNAIVRDNSAFSTGGGIFSEGTLSVSNSAIYNNSANSVFGSSGGGIANAGTATINQSTIANNNANARGSGGGIFNTGTLNANNTTIGDNSSGISNEGGEATITSTLVAGNSNNNDLEGDIISGGNNLIGGDSSSSLDPRGNLVNAQDSEIVGEADVTTTDNSIDALLSELQNNGGSTPTIALLENSPAIDAGSNPNGFATDQRGEGFDRTVGNGTDIGAFELQTIDNGGGGSDELIVSISEDENDGDFSEGDLSLREAIANAESGDTISFASNLSGSTINLSLGELAIDKNLTINGLGSDQLTIDAGDNSRVFNINDGNEDNFLDVTLDGLAIANGNATSSNGGGIFTNENLELANSSISGNGTTSAGAGIYSSGEKLNISNTTIADNLAPKPLNRIFARGAGIATVGTTVEITNSQITGNTAISGGGGIDLRDSNLTVVDSIITGNFGAFAGGIAAENSTVNVSNSSVNNNRTNIYGGSGAINTDANSVLTVDRSTIDGNSGIDPYNPSPPRGSEAFASGIGTRGTTTITNSTISNSTVERIDEPISEDDPRNSLPEATSTIGFGIRNTGDLNVVNSTFAGNEDGAISNEGGTVNISNTTIADALANINLAEDPNATVSSSIVVDNSQELETAIDSNQNLIGSSDNLNLAELQDNGGATQTIALSEGSQAIDAVSNPNNLATDQRGEGFDRTVGNGTDIGAFELQDSTTTTPEFPDAVVVSTLEDENDGDFSEGDLSLREAISIANEQEGTDIISFAESLSGGTISLSENIEDPRGLGTINAELLITDSVEIDGLGAKNLTLDGLNAGNGIFRIEGDNTNVTVEGLNITNGSRRAFFFNGATVGGAVVASSNSSFILRNSVISNSIADSAGAISSSGNVEIVNSLITGNESGGGQSPGGAVVVNGNLSVINSTIAQNTGIGITNLGTAAIANSTITDGIRLINPDSTTITSSIVSRNNSEANAPSIFSNLGQGITSGGNNLIGNGDDLTGFVDSDLVGTGDDILDPLLGELRDNGGATQTLELLSDSLAIDAGSNLDNLTTDQRGEGFERTVGNGIDIGAFELQNGKIEVPNLEGTDGDDSLSGEGTNDDVISGGAGNDTLDGNGGHDNISGDDGDDLLTGGAGADTLIGGAGHDVFVLEASDVHDTVVDFELGEDRLQLSESLTLGQLSIVDNESNTGSLILDSNNHDAIIAAIENVHFSDLEVHII